MEENIAEKVARLRQQKKEAKAKAEHSTRYKGVDKATQNNNILNRVVRDRSKLGANRNYARAGTGSTEMTSYDKVRLGAALTDLVGMGVSMTGPVGNVVGGVAGVGATLADLYADSEDGISWEDAGNAVLNLGLDAATFIPIGGTFAKDFKLAHKMPKIVKTLTHLSMGAAGVYFSGGPALAALNKMKEGSYKDLNSQDIVALVRGVQAVLGGATMAKHEYNVATTTKGMHQDFKGLAGATEGMADLSKMSKEQRKGLNELLINETKAQRYAREKTSIENKNWDPAKKAEALKALDAKAIDIEPGVYKVGANGTTFAKNVDGKIVKGIDADPKMWGLGKKTKLGKYFNREKVATTKEKVFDKILQPKDGVLKDPILRKRYGEAFARERAIPEFKAKAKRWIRGSEKVNADGYKIDDSLVKRVDSDIPAVRDNTVKTKVDRATDVAGYNREIDGRIQDASLSAHKFDNKRANSQLSKQDPEMIDSELVKSQVASTANVDNKIAEYKKKRGSRGGSGRSKDKRLEDSVTEKPIPKNETPKPDSNVVQNVRNKRRSNPNSKKQNRVQRAANGLKTQKFEEGGVIDPKNVKPLTEEQMVEKLAQFTNPKDQIRYLYKSGYLKVKPEPGRVPGSTSRIIDDPAQVKLVVQLLKMPFPERYKHFKLFGSEEDPIFNSVYTDKEGHDVTKRMTGYISPEYDKTSAEIKRKDLGLAKGYTVLKSLGDGDFLVSYGGKTITYKEAMKNTKSSSSDDTMTKAYELARGAMAKSFSNIHNATPEMKQKLYNQAYNNPFIVYKGVTGREDDINIPEGVSVFKVLDPVKGEPIKVEGKNRDFMLTDELVTKISNDYNKDIGDTIYASEYSKNLAKTNNLIFVKNDVESPIIGKVSSIPNEFIDKIGEYMGNNTKVAKNLEGMRHVNLNDYDKWMGKNRTTDRGFTSDLIYKQAEKDGLVATHKVNDKGGHLFYVPANEEDKKLGVTDVPVFIYDINDFEDIHKKYIEIRGKAIEGHGKGTVTVDPKNDNKVVVKGKTDLDEKNKGLIDAKKLDDAAAIEKAKKEVDDAKANSNRIVSDLDTTPIGRRRLKTLEVMKPHTIVDAGLSIGAAMTEFETNLKGPAKPIDKVFQPDYVDQTTVQEIKRGQGEIRSMEIDTADPLERRDYLLKQSKLAGEMSNKLATLHAEVHSSNVKEEQRIKNENIAQQNAYNQRRVDFDNQVEVQRVAGQKARVDQLFKTASDLSRRVQTDYETAAQARNEDFIQANVNKIENQKASLQSQIDRIYYSNKPQAVKDAETAPLQQKVDELNNQQSDFTAKVISGQYEKEENLGTRLTRTSKNIAKAEAVGDVDKAERLKVRRERLKSKAYDLYANEAASYNTDVNGVKTRKSIVNYAGDKETYAKGKQEFRDDSLNPTIIDKATSTVKATAKSLFEKINPKKANTEAIDKMNEGINNPDLATPDIKKGTFTKMSKAQQTRQDSVLSSLNKEGKDPVNKEVKTDTETVKKGTQSTITKTNNVSVKKDRSVSEDSLKNDVTDADMENLENSKTKTLKLDKLRKAKKARNNAKTVTKK